MSIVEELAEVAHSQPGRLRNEKKRGIKVIGLTGQFVPEELIYAAGAMPYLICRGGEVCQ